jgi:hypothetical protein
MDGWDIALVAIAGYVALLGLVRLMIRRRNRLVDELLGEAEQQERTRKEAEPSTSPRSG